jgi:hypothetical protein
VTEGIDRNEQLRTFVESLRVERREDGTFSATPPEGWGPRLLGGMVVALCLNAGFSQYTNTVADLLTTQPSGSSPR